MVKKRFNPKNYDGVRLTTHRLCDILPKVLSHLGEVHEVRPDLIIASWPDIIGAKLASMTRALTFEEGTLTVKVNNSTLHSLLVTHEKAKLLRHLRKRFPKAGIENIYFRLG